MSERYTIVCKTCKSTFDCASQLDVWKEELLEKIEEIIIELKGGKDNDKTKRNM